MDGPPIKRPRLNEFENNPQPLMRDLNQTNNQTNNPITLTLASGQSQNPSVVISTMHSSSSGIHGGGGGGGLGGNSLNSSVSSGMRELANVSSVAAHQPSIGNVHHGPIALHYGNPQAITLTLASQQAQAHAASQNTNVTTNSSIIGGINTPTSSSLMGAHYGVPLSTQQQQQLLSNQTSGGGATKSYMVSRPPPPVTNNPQTIIVPPSGGNGDSGDEGISVSIHVSNPINDQMSGGSSQESNAGHSASTASSQSEQRLKVEDALNYLDQVKYKFGNQPQVYNDFLDIMKEFKSQSIDTPGVIARVSHLFRGHPELIVGFNTFLPPGYKIEVQTNDQVSLSMIGQTGGYVVTTVQPGGISSCTATHPGGPPISSNSIIQHPSNIQPLRPTTPHTSSHSLIESNVSISSNGRVSPNNITSGLTTNNINNYEGGPTSTFTHSYTSPFVPSPMFPSLQSQPVEFNHAINYVNKIKNRFQGQPDKYKQFLEILHTYQKEQRNIKEGLPPSAKHLTELEVYTQVSKLFENQDDLLQEFGQFLPDATNQPNIVSGLKNNIEQVVKKNTKIRDFQTTTKATGAAPKRPVLQQPPKKVKLAQFKDVSLSEASKYGTLKEYAFFDKVRQALRSQEAYDNFLRCLALYNEEVLSRSELVQIVNPFLTKSPELQAWFKDFIGINECASVGYEPVPINAIKQEKISEEQALEIDFSTCKRLGASYCALPKNHVPPKCSGRSNLCKEVLNDIWVSFPTWSEDSTFITSRKTQFEEYIYRCEDERFELDVVIETNASTIRVLETVSKKISRMTPEELGNFSLDDCLGGSSPTIHQRAIRRLYGDKASEIIQGLKSHPSLAVPIVLRRLKSKEEEWREAQKSFNRIWREQIERFYLKSLDHQGLTFKQGDMRALRSKALINEIETLFDERNEQIATGAVVATTHHMTLQFRDRAILDDACNLLLHHVRRQSGIQKDDKRRIKVILKQFIPDLFHHQRMELSDDENEEGSHDEQDSSHETNGGKNGAKRNGKKTTSRGKKENGNHDTSEAGTKGASLDSESRRVVAKREQKVLNEQLKAQQRDALNAGTGTGDVPLPYLVPTGDDGLAENFIAPPKEPKVVVVSSKAGEDVSSNVIENVNMPDEGAPGQRIIHIPVDDDDSYTLFYVNNSWYIFLRLHQILCERLTKMYDCAMNAYVQESNENVLGSSKSPASTLRLRPKSDVKIAELYPTFLEMVRNLLDGNMEMSVYEDLLREMFGIQAYIVYTMDKVIANSVRQLQTLVTDETCQQCLDLFQQADKQKGTGGLCATSGSRISQELAYQKKSEKAFAQENCIKVIIYKKAFQMTMELLENTEPSQEQTEENARWSNYIEDFSNKNSTADLKLELLQKPVFLSRNIRQWKKLRQQSYTENADSAPTTSSVSLLAEALKKAKENKSKESNDDDDSDNNDEPSEKPKEANNDEIKVEATETPTENKDAELDEKQLELAELEKKLAEKEELRKKKLNSPELILQENLQCQFNPNSYKMVYVVHSENFMYLKGALKRAREAHKKVSLKLNDAFGKWHQNWIEEFCTEDQITRNEDWFMSAKNSMTKVISSNDISKAPYRPFNRYKVLKRGATGGD